MSGAAGPIAEEDQEDKPHPPPLWQSVFRAAAVVGVSEIPEEIFGLRFPERRQQYCLCPDTITFPSIAAAAPQKSKKTVRLLRPISDRRQRPPFPSSAIRLLQS